MKNVLSLMRKVIKDGDLGDARTVVNRKSIFGHELRFNMADGFPLMTTKKVFWKGITNELLWFIHGMTNIKHLVNADVHIWDEWALKEDIKSKRALTQDERVALYAHSVNMTVHTIKLVLDTKTWDECVDMLKDIPLELEETVMAKGYLGPVYGEQWGNWPTPEGEDNVDQLANVIQSIKDNPHSARHIVSAWNPSVLPDESISPEENVKRGKQALPPCHMLFQLYVRNGKISLRWDQRSVDLCLGAPFNIASYALLLHLIAKQTNLIPHELILHAGDVHIYENHLETAGKQVKRKPRALPTITIADDIESIRHYKTTDFHIELYHPHEALKYEISK